MTKRTSTLGITFEVREDNRRPGWFVILRAGTLTESSGGTLKAAINTAIEEARLEAATTGQRTRVISILGAERREEWKSFFDH